MSLTREEVLHIARLTRVGLSEEDVARLQQQLSNILEHFQVLQEVDTEGVPPTGHSVALESVMREDSPAESYSVVDVMANSPAREGGFFRVRQVLEE